MSGGRNSVKAPPEKSCFARSCNLLSQYVKEKGSLRDINLGISGKHGVIEASDDKTMNLLTKMEKGESDQTMDVSNNASSSKRTTFGTKTDQLTIFYAGQVVVFDDFPADKARDLMILLSSTKSSAGQVVMFDDFPADKARDIMILLSSTKSSAGAAPVAASAANNSDQAPQKQPVASTSSDLPIARRSSLHRFLEKRKGRANERAPYQIVNPEAKLSRKAKEKLDKSNAKPAPTAFINVN